MPAAVVVKPPGEVVAPPADRAAVWVKIADPEQVALLNRLKVTVPVGVYPVTVAASLRTVPIEPLALERVVPIVGLALVTLRCSAAQPLEAALLLGSEPGA